MISGLNWVARGKAKNHPQKYEPTEEEVDKLKKKGEKAKAASKSESDASGDQEMSIEKLYGFDKESDDDYSDVDIQVEAGVVEDDPMIQLDSDSEEELDDTIIRSTDSLLFSIVANDENDISHLDMYIYEETSNNLYVHHDIFLTSFPLCTTWLDFNKKDPSTPASHVAIGSFSPAIEIWDLDVLDPVSPVLMLGGRENQKKNGKLIAGSHSDAVMGLDWNTKQRNVLASSSADNTVKIWDLERGTCVQTYTQHKDKVGAVQWNPQEASVVVCGSYDRTVTILDVRSASSEVSLRWPVTADVEAVLWNPLSPQHFFVACEDGSVMLFDALKGGNSPPVWTLIAHDKATSAISMNNKVPILATGSTDKSVKLWNLSGSKPELLYKQHARHHVYGASFYNSSAPHLLAYGGDHAMMEVLNLHKMESTAPFFGKVAAPMSEKKKNKQKKKEEKMREDDEDEDEDEEDEPKERPAQQKKAKKVNKKFPSKFNKKK